MAYISYKKYWVREFGNNSSKEDKIQDMNIDQLKLERHDTFEKDEKLKTTFEPTDDSDVVNKSLTG